MSYGEERSRFAEGNTEELAMPAEKNAVESMLDQLKEDTNMLEHAMGLLSNKIQPVLSQPRPEVASESSDRKMLSAGDSSLFTTLRQLDAQIKAINRMTIDLRDRVEL